MTAAEQQINTRSRGSIAASVGAASVDAPPCAERLAARSSRRGGRDGFFRLAAPRAYANHRSPSAWRGWRCDRRERRATRYVPSTRNSFVRGRFVLPAHTAGLGEIDRAGFRLSWLARCAIAFVEFRFEGVRAGVARFDGADDVLRVLRAAGESEQAGKADGRSDFTLHSS